ncbi:hypothetical protein CDAR_485231 [Caerostris darwini]|uniref:Uncharacterized protein n=1 Tax=Caerostris darwini TaxID=1538125 RepID=A0AAV4PAV9_9ARAC|nr:hypothetical protein CDAR_485231 [Caerostris darwini]
MKFFGGVAQGVRGRMHKGSDSSPSLWWRRVIARNLPSLSRTSEIVVGEKHNRKGSLTEEIDPSEDFDLGETVGHK